jgi:hypothetical protein
MVFEVPPYWDAAIDGVQIVLCLLILVFLFRFRSKKKQNRSEGSSHGSGPSFNEQVLTQSLKQRVDQSLLKIAEAIAVEQRNLDKWLASLDLRHLQAGYPQYTSQLQRSAGGEIQTIASDVSGIDLVHAQIQNLADQGMTAQQISEKLKSPLSEVELVLSLGDKVGKRPEG